MAATTSQPCLGDEPHSKALLDLGPRLLWRKGWAQRGYSFCLGRCEINKTQLEDQVIYPKSVGAHGHAAKHIGLNIPEALVKGVSDLLAQLVVNGAIFSQEIVVGGQQIAVQCAVVIVGCGSGITVQNELASISREALLDRHCIVWRRVRVTRPRRGFCGYCCGPASTTTLAD